MRLDEAEVRARFAQARVARLATVSGVGSPHLVPITFVLTGSQLVTAIDAKPKSTTALRRLDNIAVNPFVSVLVDDYVEDWTRLWWARGDGWATVHESYDLAALIAKYAQYSENPPVGPVIVVEIDHWSGWSAG